MKFTQEEETKTVDYITIGDQKFRAYAVKRLLEELSDTDPHSKRIEIRDADLEEVLASETVIWRSVRGSVAKGKGYDDFVKRFEQATGYEVERD